MSPHSDSPNHTAPALIRQLPVEARLLVNNAIREGLSSGEIAAQLLQQGFASVTPETIEAWRTGGYVAWLNQQERVEVLNRRSTVAQHVSEVLKQSDIPELAGANWMIVASEINELFDFFGPEKLKQFFEKKPEQFVQVIVAIAIQAAQGKVERLTESHS